ncbi:PsiF repeat-containing protein [Beijerinckia sp. L45]|uniref:PsiF repeat-containing protein n=1 Tax=Beijerinckia sp. L45 TaxID=1641855 RepID=UPI00131ABBD1|nr:PsiF repeat-containing protein [Beijerinckia sp. L45]
MKLSALTILASLCLAAPAFAQSATPAAPTTAPAAATTAPEMNKDGKPKAKAVRKACRTEAKSQGLKGDAREKAITDCFVKQRPDLAAKETARDQCRADAKAKGLEKGADRKAFVKSCEKDKK